MDFHAHLDRNEIIGLLAGSWDPQQVWHAVTCCNALWCGVLWCAVHSGKGRTGCGQQGGQSVGLLSLLVYVTYPANTLWL